MYNLCQSTSDQETIRDGNIEIIEIQTDCENDQSSEYKRNTETFEIKQGRMKRLVFNDQSQREFFDNDKSLSDAETVLLFKCRGIFESRRRREAQLQNVGLIGQKIDGKERRQSATVIHHRICNTKKYLTLKKISSNGFLPGCKEVTVH